LIRIRSSACRTGKVYVWGSNGEGTLAIPSNDRDSPGRRGTKPCLRSRTARRRESSWLQGASRRIFWLTAKRMDGAIIGSTSVGAEARPSSSPPRPQFYRGRSVHGHPRGGNHVDDGHSVAVDAADNAYCWGDHQEGQCGVGSTEVVAVPPVVTQALAGGQYSMFLATDTAV
jgi:hypothetical protein